jgi:hypothetical protein
MCNLLTLKSRPHEVDAIIHCKEVISAEHAVMARSYGPVCPEADSYGGEVALHW